MLVGIADQDRR